MIASFRTCIAGCRCICIAGVSAEKTVTVSGHEHSDPFVTPEGKEAAAAAAAAADKKSGTTSPECAEEPADSGDAQSPSDALPQDSAPSPVPGNAH